jgi:predicted pyridoxine 5'-phosphate oxidase superfamily flavin-nucleotide-binding protein
METTMGHRFAEIAFTGSVRQMQETMGSRHGYERLEGGPEGVNAVLGPDEAGFISARDSLYMATVGETGWPYVQHRGGPPGFVRVLDEATIGFADFRGNRQYVSVGNALANDRVSLFFMDYANRTRLKMLGRIEVIGADHPLLLDRLAVPAYRAKVERGLLVHVEAFDWNCPQHITPRFTAAEVEAATAPLRRRIADLESRLAAKGGAQAAASPEDQ